MAWTKRPPSESARLDLAPMPCQSPPRQHGALHDGWANDSRLSAALYATLVDRAPRPEFALLVGTYRPAVAAARALDRRGLHVIAGIGPDPRNLERSAGVEFSRHVRQVWRHPDPVAAPEAFLSALVRKVERLGERVYVFPFFEPVLALLSQTRDRLPPNATLVAPSQRVIDICMDKERLLDEADAAGLPSLPHATVSNLADLRGVMDAMGEVAIRPLAPRTSLVGHKALLCTTPMELARALPVWPSGHDRLLVQRLARGPRLNVHFAARGGQLVGHVEVIAVRTNRFDGTGLTVEAHTQPTTSSVLGQMERLVRHLAYTGVGLAQFIIVDQVPHVIELNPRLGAVYVIAERKGLDLANMAVDLAVGADSRTLVSAAHRGPIRSAWTLGDLAGLIQESRQGKTSLTTGTAWLRRLVTTALRADVHATWSWKDPVPAVATWSRFLVSLAIRRASPHLLFAALRVGRDSAIQTLATVAARVRSGR